MLANFLELVFALSAYALELRSVELELRSMEHHHGLELRSTSTERLELFSGRQRRGRGRCCWPRYYLGADVLQHAEGGQPLEQVGALELGDRSLLLGRALAVLDIGALGLLLDLDLERAELVVPSRDAVVLPKGGGG